MSATLYDFATQKAIDEETLPPPVEPVGVEVVAGTGRILMVGHAPTLTTDARLRAGAGRVDMDGGGKASTTARASEEPPQGPRSAPPVAEPATKADIPRMSEPVSRDEMNAKFEAMGARMDARFAEMQAVLAKLPSKWELFGYTATVAALAVAVIAVIVAMLAWRQDQFIAISNKAASPPQAQQPIIINVPPAPAAPAATPTEPPAKP